MLGDVVISVDSALRESREFEEDLEFTIDRLLIHGVLHLWGYDHEKSRDAAMQMEKEERRLLSLIHGNLKTVQIHESNPDPSAPSLPT
jgi:probable rRNA maturation factor